MFPNHSTGICVCLICKENRCCYANIGASIYFQKEFLQGKLSTLTTPNIEAIQVFYIESFFITGNRFSVCEYIINEVCQPSNGKKQLAINLSASYLIEKFPSQIKYLVEHSSILFGNKGEFLKLAEAYGMQSVEDILKYLIETSNHEKIIISTNGAESITYCYKHSDSDGGEMDICKKYALDAVPVEIVDTTGCGDVFVAGFFYAFLRSQSLENCIKNGVDVANKKIQTIGGSLKA